jgi:hypothetical protein
VATGDGLWELHALMRTQTFSSMLSFVKRGLWMMLIQSHGTDCLQTAKMPADEPDPNAWACSQPFIG